MSNRLVLLIAVALLAPSWAMAASPVKATLGKETAWTGEGVPLIITLYSPGPFSGTASFDLPQLPQTVLVRAGSPLVGSESVDGESYMTQRHEFTLFTQRSGRIVIPPFAVRFTAKKTFTSDPAAVEDATPELHFQSNRPTGTEKLGTVVAVMEMKATQTWLPDSDESVHAGDVIQRTIDRRAVGTTAMILPPFTLSSPEGVRVYAGDPIVRDHTERGASNAERMETIKYQFERAGTVELPDVQLVWWDLQANELKRKKLPGRAFNVVESQVVPLAAEGDRAEWPLPILILALATIGLIGWLVRKPVTRLLDEWRERRQDSEPLAATHVRSACRSGNAADAYAALLDWKRAVDGSARRGQLDALLSSGQANDLRQQWSDLSRHVFGENPDNAPWSGRQLVASFTQARRKLRQIDGPPPQAPILPPLNPNR